jgi:drug/metabolite transporter (DMT)-like permease
LDNGPLYAFRAARTIPVTPLSFIPMSPRSVNLALLFALSAIWGSSYMLIKLGLETVPPVTVAAVRITFGALALLLVMQLRGHRLPIIGRGWIPFVIMAIFGSALPFSLIAWGETHITSSLTTILLGVVPVSTMLLAHLFTQDERFTRAKVGGLVAGFIGLVVIIGPDALAGIRHGVVGQAAIVAAALCYAVSIVYARRMRHILPLVNSACTMTAAAIIIMPFSLIMDRPWLLAPSITSMTALAVLGVLGTGLAALIFFRLIAGAGATFTSMINYLIPLVGVTWGGLFLGEELPLSALLGLALILSGVALINRPAKTPESD